MGRFDKPNGLQKCQHSLTMSYLSSGSWGNNYETIISEYFEYKLGVDTSSPVK